PNCQTTDRDRLSNSLGSRSPTLDLKYQISDLRYLNPHLIFQNWYLRSQISNLRFGIPSSQCPRDSDRASPGTAIQNSNSHRPQFFRPPRHRPEAAAQWPEKYP